MNQKKPSKYGIPERLEGFRRHCMNEGYELLPEDYRFIDSILNEFSQTDFKGILSEYLDEWCNGVNEAGSSNLAQGLGRRRANKWLFGIGEQRRQELKKINDRGRPWDKCFD